MDVNICLGSGNNIFTSVLCIVFEDLKFFLSVQQCSMYIDIGTCFEIRIAACVCRCIVNLLLT